MRGRGLTDRSKQEARKRKGKEGGRGPAKLSKAAQKERMAAVRAGQKQG